MRTMGSTIGQRQILRHLFVSHKVIALEAGSLTVRKPRKLGTREGRRWQLHLQD